MNRRGQPLSDREQPFRDGAPRAIVAQRDDRRVVGDVLQGLGVDPKAEMYLPKINQIQEYDLSHHSEIVQQYLLLGFGTESNPLRKAYDVKLVGEEDVNGDTTAVLELTPLKANVAAQIAKVSLWINEESWLPVEQKFFEPGGDYLETKYTSVVVNRDLPSSIFEIPAAKGAKRVKMG